MHCYFTQTVSNKWTLVGIHCKWNHDICKNILQFASATVIIKICIYCLLNSVHCPAIEMPPMINKLLKSNKFYRSQNYFLLQKGTTVRIFDDKEADHEQCKRFNSFLSRAVRHHFNCQEWMRRNKKVHEGSHKIYVR